MPLVNVLLSNVLIQSPSTWNQTESPTKIANLFRFPAILVILFISIHNKALKMMTSWRRKICSIIYNVVLLLEN